MDNLGKALDKAMKPAVSAGGDYYDDQGYLMCGKCHTRKETDLPVPFRKGPAKVGITCRCETERWEREEQEALAQRRQDRVERMRREGIADRVYARYTFAADDGESPASKVCRRYVDAWEDMEKNGVGILFTGTVGTGKSFLGCCIANALIDRLIPAGVVSLPRLLNAPPSKVQDGIDRMEGLRLLVIDDLGVERSTSFAAEQVYNLVDSRSRSGLPLIVTTNLTLDELQSPSDRHYARIYDRVLEMCPMRINLVGASRRGGTAARRKAIAQEILGGKHEQR